MFVCMLWMLKLTCELCAGLLSYVNRSIIYEVWNLLLFSTLPRMLHYTVPKCVSHSCSIFGLPAEIITEIKFRMCRVDAYHWHCLGNFSQKWSVYTVNMILCLLYKCCSEWCGPRWSWRSLIHALTLTLSSRLDFASVWNPVCLASFL